MKMKRKAGKFANVLVYCILVIGIILILYPTFASYVNGFTQSRAIAGYTDIVETIKPDQSQIMLEQARVYNASLVSNSGRFTLSEKEWEIYSQILNITGTGIIGYIEIPSIDVSLPVYHGTNDSVLQAGVGHMAGSSFPVGGESTHSVISGHSGMVSSRLLTDLNEVENGDYFFISVLGEKLAYQVDQIKTVLPDETDDLAIVDGEDYVTLVTCTPYGVNSHRLLVRGTRVEMPDEDAHAATEQDTLRDHILFFVKILVVPCLIGILIDIVIQLYLKIQKGGRR